MRRRARRFDKIENKLLVGWVDLTSRGPHSQFPSLEKLAFGSEIPYLVLTTWHLLLLKLGILRVNGTFTVLRSTNHVAFPMLHFPISCWLSQSLVSKTRSQSLQLPKQT